MSALCLRSHAGFRCLSCVSGVEGIAVLEHAVLTDLLRPGCVLLEVVVQYSKPIDYHSYCVHDALFRLPLRFDV